MLSAGLQDAAITSEAASERLSLVIIGLLGLAVVIGVVTIVFWRLTRPERGRSGADLRWIPESRDATESTEEPSGSVRAEGDDPPR